MKNFPKQRLSYQEKIKNDYRWAKDVIDSLLIDYAGDRTIVNSYHSDYDRKLSNYQLFNNFLNQKDFERECNPLGIEVGQFKDEIQPYNKTYNKIQVLLGEELRRPFNYKVILTNPDGVRSKLSYRDDLFRNYIYSKIQEALELLGNQLEEPIYDPSTLIDPADIDSYMSTKYLSAKEITGSKILNYLTKNLSLKDLKNDAFKHGLISGEEFVYVGKSHDEPTVEVLNSLGVFYHKSPEVKYIQDGLYAGYRTYMSSGDVMDKFGASLSIEDQSRIDSRRNSVGGYFRDDTINPTMKYFHDDYWYDNYLNAPLHEGSYSDSTYSMEDWLVQHVEWKSQKKVGFITYVNMYGDEEMDIVSEDFIVPDHAKAFKDRSGNVSVTKYLWTDIEQTTYTLEWGWIPEVWEGVRIADDIYCNIGPKEYQFRDYANPYSVKLGYHGLVYNSMNATSVSMMDRMKPFQYLYFIIMHKLKKLIAQDKGRVFHFDTSMIDPKIGLEKTLYYLTTLNIDFYNPLQNAEQPGWSQRGKVSGSTDLSVADQINNYINILSAIDQQISDVAGVTPQREGQAQANEAVTNAEANRQMSVVVTEVYFQAHNKLWEQVLNSLINVAQTCYKHKNAVKQFILDDLSIATLELTPDSLTNASFGVFVTDSPKEQYIFDTLQTLSQALLQNDKAKFSDIIKMLEATSTEQLKQQIIQSERQSSLQEQQQQQMMLEAQAAQQQADQNFQFEYQEREHKNKILLAEIDSFKFQKDQDVDDNGIPDQLEVQKFLADNQLKREKLELEKNKLRQQKEKDDRDAELRKRDLAIKARKKPSN